MPEPRRVTAKVLGVDKDCLMIDAGGYVVRVFVDHETMLDGEKTRADRPIKAQLESAGAKVEVK